jgi:hypothetical protein
MKKDVEKINVEFTKSELDLLSEICMEELYNIGKLQYQRFINRKLVTERIENIKKLMDKILN